MSPSISRSMSGRRNKITSYLPIYLAALLVTALILGIAGAASAQQPIAQGTQIPVIVNIYNNSGMTEAEARQAIGKANECLKAAGLKLTVVKVNTGATAGDVGQDGDITSGTEEADVVNKGEEEIRGTPNKRGIKIDFFRTPDYENASNPGFVLGKRPVVVTRKRYANDGTTYSPERTGQTIAHEVGHIMCLDGGHKIDDKTNANSAGHAPDQAGAAGRENAMAPSNYRTDCKLTKDQIEKMKKSQYVHGKCSSQWERAYPAKKEKQQHGASTDAIRESGIVSPHLDLWGTDIWSRDGFGNLYGRIGLTGLIPCIAPGALGIGVGTYALAFDSDGNPMTGYPYDGFVGREYALEITAIPGELGCYAVGMVRNLATGRLQPLPEAPVVYDAQRLTDLAGHGGQRVMSQVRFTLPKEMVGLPVTLPMEWPTQIPVGISAKYQYVVNDTDSLVFSLDRWLQDPSLDTFGTGVPTPGQPYPFRLSGLQPNSAFQLSVDNRPVFTGILDPMGGYTGEFTFPGDLSNHYWYFLTAQDETGEFAYSITCPEPVTTLVEAKALGDTGFCDVSGIVPGAFDDFYYLEAGDRSCGIRVEQAEHGASAGEQANVIGTVVTNTDGERYIDAALVTRTTGTDCIPLSMANRLLGGGNWRYDATTGAGQSGVLDGYGVNNIGLLVRIWGKVTARGARWFYVDDGSGLDDGTGIEGVKVTTLGMVNPPTELPAEGSFVVVTGMSSCEIPAGGTRPVRLVRPRSAGDIVVFLIMSP